MYIFVPMQDGKNFVSFYTYFGSIQWFANIMAANSWQLTNSIYNKNWHLNQMKIATANGAHVLSIPLLGGRSQHTPVADLQISATDNWQVKHLRTLKAAYGNAPFFEIIFPYLEDMYSKPWHSLAALNKATFELACKLMQIQLLPTSIVDSTLQKPYTFYQEPYIQVFTSKTGFVPNCSILDLLMQEGKNSILIIRKMIV